MYELKNFELEGKMNSAFIYLAENFHKTGHNKKPVVSHSIMVGTTLYHCGYSDEIVIAGILHDLIEDTDITYDDIKNEFGEKVADIVQVVSFDDNIDNKEEQTRELFGRVKKYGYEAIVVKCADLFCNLPFFVYVKKEEVIHYLKDKYHLFIDMFDNDLKGEKLYEAYLNRCSEILN